MIMMIQSVYIFAFTSSSTARFLVEGAEALSRKEELYQALEEGTVAAIGLPTAQELERLGIRVDVMPESFTFQAMLALLKERSER
jgi:uroporphyrinogen-III synthase